ncbi:MAG: CDP-alcohol phosphatidyltransferase family protein [Lentisphaerae bacterium]|nr:CDP-alcohol phosphatidyltransferase family protein [Lentisphaerota bacterium]
MKWRQILPTTVTLMAMLAGFLSILVTVEGIRNFGAEAGRLYRWAALLIMLAMILDGIDGNLARWIKGSSEFGAELDTYVDMTAFGISPAILIFAVTLQSEPLWRVALPSAVAISGVVRLARFKVKDPLRGQGGYAGLPITVNAAWVALFVFICQTPPLNRFSLNEGKVAGLFLAGIFVFIILQVTSLRYPKPTKKAALFIPCVILVALLLVLTLVRAYDKASRVAVIMLALGMIYVVIGPMFVKSVAIHKARKAARTRLNEE